MPYKILLLSFRCDLIDYCESGKLGGLHAITESNENTLSLPSARSGTKGLEEQPLRTGGSRRFSFAFGYCVRSGKFGPPFEIIHEYDLKLTQ